MDKKTYVNIENVVSSATLNQRIDLNAIVRKFPSVEYKPEQFPGLVYRLKKPKTATLVFSSGKMVCTGAKSETQSKKAVQRVVDDLMKEDIITIAKPDIKVQNIVASSDLGVEVNLNAIAISLGLEKVEYEPEQFPGLVYRIEKPKVVVLLFGSGKLVCTGARRPEDVSEAVEKITEELTAAGLLR